MIYCPTCKKPLMTVEEKEKLSKMRGIGKHHFYEFLEFKHLFLNHGLKEV